MPTPRPASTAASALERVEAILANPAIYELAELIPAADLSRGGRPRHYPDFMALVFEALLSVYNSARRVEVELAHPTVWNFIRDRVRAHFPDQTDRWLPEQPMRRHHYRYLRNRYLTQSTVLALINERHRTLAADQARQLGLLDATGPGSWTHPDLSRMLHADGKVITPLFKARPDDRCMDPATGEVVIPRHEHDAHLHVEGDGNNAWGIKFVLVAARTADPHGRIILDLEWVPQAGAEARVAMDCFTRLAPLVPGAQGVVYDTALRGVHHQTLLRDLGLLPVNRVAAAHAGARKPRRGEGRRVEKSAHVEDRAITVDGHERVISLYARGGAIGIGELNEAGELTYTPLPRIRTHRNHDKNGHYRWYCDFRLPEHHGNGTITVRMHNNAQDAARRFNRTENVRAIPPGDPDFARLYPRRLDAESINRGVDDSLWIGRAHSLGHARQLLNLIGFALMVNALALHRHRRQPDQLAA
jgi:hypothetical protein